MSAEVTAPKTTALSGKSELGVAVLLGAMGAIALVDAATLTTNAATRGPLNSATVPIVVGLLLIGVAIALFIDVLRGGRGEMEGGEDIDLEQPTAWVPFVAIGAIFLANAFLMEPLGWPITGTALFWGAATALGSRHLVRDLLISLVIAFGSYFLFAYALGVDLPAGLLGGVI
ncbi:tripartite tricarboxylate transporter TctB family protein [Mycobacterium sp. 236(2023)]|uniref:tripartite tricarboxylate transporter TctB family protein n=1 Tax=Mycobacterium sp. 236(2023) TaxID=3038163 RepID=UPI0024153225|nr:tripartite tricarboxylate transporter TctB family protein [Mycobacterium sp. 236(2023)]MDG4668157.1 tripartite tricarboxylate transporter TctB family protein [Mycobacterium sp. 236(2023)]